MSIDVVIRYQVVCRFPNCSINAKAGRENWEGDEVFCFALAKNHSQHTGHTTDIQRAQEYINAQPEV